MEELYVLRVMGRSRYDLVLGRFLNLVFGSLLDYLALLQRLL